MTTQDANHLAHAERWARQCLDDFLAHPDSLTKERTELAMLAVLRFVEGQRRKERGKADGEG